MKTVVEITEVGNIGGNGFFFSFFYYSYNEFFFHSLLQKPLLDHFGKKRDNLYESVTALLQNDVWYIGS